MPSRCASSDRRSFRSSVARSSRRSARSESERPCDDSGWSSSRASIVRSTERSKRVSRLDMTTLHQQLNDLSSNWRFEFGPYCAIRLGPRGRELSAEEDDDHPDVDDQQESEDGAQRPV